MQKFKVNVSQFRRQSGNKRTDGQMDGGGFITSLANAVDNQSDTDNNLA